MNPFIQQNPLVNSIPVVSNVETTVNQIVNIPQNLTEVNSENVSSENILDTLHLQWGNDKVIEVIGGKISKTNTSEQLFSFLNWLNTVEVDGLCLDKKEVLYVLRNKLKSDTDKNITYLICENIWNSMKMPAFAKRLNVKKGYSRVKLTLDWE